MNAKSAHAESRSCRTHIFGKIAIVYRSVHKLVLAVAQ